MAAHVRREPALGWVLGWVALLACSAAHGFELFLPASGCLTLVLCEAETAAGTALRVHLAGVNTPAGSSCHPGQFR